MYVNNHVTCWTPPIQIKPKGVSADVPGQNSATSQHIEDGEGNLQRDPARMLESCVIRSQATIESEGGHHRSRRSDADPADSDQYVAHRGTVLLIASPRRSTNQEGTGPDGLPMQLLQVNMRGENTTLQILDEIVKVQEGEQEFRQQ